MLFNSYIFIFIFLPVVLCGFYLIIRKANHRLAIAWLVFTSLFFYGWWNPKYVLLILASVLFNYFTGRIIERRRRKNRPGPNKLILSLGIAGNLLALGYFKYANFFADNLNLFTGSNMHLGKIILPLAISFHTFQQIAYLVDTYRGKLGQYDLLHYFLFVTFFPQMIAGPIVKHDEILPQISNPTFFRFSHSDIAVGFSIFIIGLFKKLFLADPMAACSTPVFESVARGISPSFSEAWGAALGYTFQIYFDFSGYSDMAIGLGRMFGVKIPINFNSPYKSLSIIEFWRRWHITLSRFLRDYLYIPLGGNRKGIRRQYLNLLITMFLGGIWHGAGWTYFLWGLLHGSYLVINNLFRLVVKKMGHDPEKSNWFSRQIAWGMTFVCVVAAWVIFRANNLATALIILKAMAGFNGLFPPESIFLPTMIDKFVSRIIFGKEGWARIFILLMIARFLPNTQQLMREFEPGLGGYVDHLGKAWSWLKWRPSLVWAMIMALAMLLSVLSIFRTNEFIYFQF